MEPHAGIFILCLLCIVRTSEMHPEKTEFEMGSLTYKNLSEISLEKTDGINGQFTNKPREKRALGLLLSGLAQIFGYSVTPIQIASLPNPSTMRPAMMLNPMRNDTTKQQAASSRPASMNTTAQQETIRFTGVLNFGNNSDIIGHLQRYEQIFHGSDNNSMMGTMMAPMPTPSANISTNSQTKPPLLTPFFVKIPLPIAPNLPPPTMPIEDFKYPAPLFSIMNESNKNAVAPNRKEQETIYRNNKNTEQYTLEEKEIYDEKEVSKPKSKYNHQLYTDDPSYNQQRDDKFDEVQHKQQEHANRLKEQNEQRNREKDVNYNEDELNEKYRNREEEIANRNREYTSTHESKEEQSPARDDEEEENSAERYEEHASQQANDSGESSKQSTEDEEDKTEGYSDYDKNANPNKKQFGEYKYSSDSFDKYIEPDDNRELPIGDYFHESNPEVIRDSYGKALDDKKLEDDRLSSYFSMFKHPSSEYEHSQEKVRNSEDAESEEDEKQTSVTQSYDEQVDKALQKLQDEYALPKNKYEEYDINYEGESDRKDNESKQIQNTGTSTRSKKLKANHLHGIKNSRAKRPIETNRNEAPPPTDIARPKITNSQEEIDFTRYTPLIVPVRYIDASDKMEQATTIRPKNKNKGQKNKSPHDQFLEDKVDSAASKENLASLIDLPERPRQLHEDERKELQIWPPPFDYVFDNTEPTNTVISPNLQNYLPNYQYIVKNIEASDANKSSEPSSDYVLILNNPVQNPYNQPHNIHYFPNEAMNANQNLHLNVVDTYSQEQVYVPQQNVTQQFSQASPNVTEYKEIAKDFRDYYYQPQEIPIDHLDHYRYIFEKHISQDKESPNVDIRSQITHTKKDTSKIHPDIGSEMIEQSSPIELQTAGFMQNNSPKRSRNSQLLQRRRNNSRSEDQRKDDGKMNNPSQSIQRDISFEYDPESTHGFFGLKKANNNFGSESGVSRITRENKTAKISSVLVAPELIAYHRNRSPTKSVVKPEHDMEKANVREYRNKLTRMSEQKRLNEPIH